MKILVAVLLTALITGAATFFGQVSAQTARIGANSESIDRNAEQVKRLIDAQTALLVEQRVLIQRFNDYVAVTERQRTSEAR